MSLVDIQASKAMMSVISQKHPASVSMHPPTTPLTREMFANLAPQEVRSANLAKQALDAPWKATRGLGQLAPMRYLT